jgi:hypothetical protein
MLLDTAESVRVCPTWVDKKAVPWAFMESKKGTKYITINFEEWDEGERKDGQGTFSYGKSFMFCHIYDSALIYGYNSVQEIKIGDQVRVRFDIVYDYDKETKEESLYKIVVELELIKAATEPTESKVYKSWLKKQEGAKSEKKVFVPTSGEEGKKVSFSTEAPAPVEAPAKPPETVSEPTGPSVPVPEPPPAQPIPLKKTGSRPW